MNITDKNIIIFTKKKKASFYSRISQSFGISLLVHLGIFLIAGFIIVIPYIKPPKMMFKPPKKHPKMRARKLEHRIRVKQFEKQARKPKIMNKLVSKGKGKISLPKLPPMKFSKSDFKSLPAMITPAGGHIGQLGLGGLGIGKGGEGAFQGFSEAEFFGHKVKTKSIIILADSSSSVVKKGAFDDLRKEVISMTEKFHPDTAFNVILFTDGAFSYKNEMAYATKKEKKALAEWMNKEMKINRGNKKETHGSTPIEALKVALEMEPDTIFLITDDPPWLEKNTISQRAIHVKEVLKAVRKCQNKLEERAKINTILYKPKPKEDKKGAEARAFMKSLARANGGRYKVISN